MNLTNVVYLLIFSNLIIVGCTNMVDFGFSFLAKKMPSETVKESHNRKINNLKMHRISDNHAQTRLTVSTQWFTSINKIPVLCLLTYPSSDGGAEIDANYIQWLLSAGNEIFILNYWFNDSELDKVLSLTNGLIIPGFKRVDDKNNQNYENFVFRVLNKIINLNNKNDNFPIFAIAEGASLVEKIISGDDQLLKKFEGVNGVMNNIDIATDPSQFARMNVILNNRNVNAIRERNVTAHFVEEAVDPQSYESNSNIKQLLKVVGVSKDKNGNRYVSMFEGLSLPIFGVQFHPEKMPWVHSYLAANSSLNEILSFSEDAIEISQKLLNYFTLIARLSNHICNRLELKKLGEIIKMPSIGDGKGMFKISNATSHHSKTSKSNTDDEDCIDEEELSTPANNTKITKASVNSNRLQNSNKGDLNLVQIKNQVENNQKPLSSYRIKNLRNGMKSNNK